MFRVLSLLTVAAMALMAPVLAQDVCDGVSQVHNTSLSSYPLITGVPGSPLLVTFMPEDKDRLLIVSQDGTVRIWTRGNAPTDYYTFLDHSSKIVSGGEQGLLGIAFRSDFQTNPFVYLNYSQSGTGDTVVSRMPVIEQGGFLRAVPQNEQVILTFNQPAGNHNGGMLLFDEDDYLVISTGDGGGGNDNFGLCGNGQNTTELLGSMLRIDPFGTVGNAPDCGSAGDPYRIPPSNPNQGLGGDCDEILMSGIRNAWRFSIDRENQDMYIGDVGQNCWEEVNWVDGDNVGGQNMGWRQKEGSQCFDPADAFNCDPAPVSCSGSPDCTDPTLTDPVAEYSSGCSVVAGWSYRGCRMSRFQGTFFYGDYCNGDVRSFTMDNGAAINPQEWTSAVDPNSVLQFNFSSYGIDAEGEIYLVAQNGTILKLVPPFQNVEVSGSGADFFSLEDGNWTWEDVPTTSMIPVDYYQVYRGLPNDTFSCIQSSATPDWVGDVAIPLPDALFAYLVTAVDTNGVESSAGIGRTLTSPCGAP